MQLVSYGAQDIYLTGNPQITFFKVVYRRYTNFATESVEQVFTGTTEFNRRVTCTISRNGDAITKMYLRVVLPGTTMGITNKGTILPGNKWAWVANVGHALIATYSFEIGGSIIDKQYGRWLDIWHELTKNVGLEAAYNNLIGNTDDLTSFKNSHKTSVLWIPLQFYFNTHNGLALPLIALQYHEVKVNVEFSTLPSLINYEYGLDLSTFTSTMSMVSASLYVDYVYLDTDERKRFATSSHEYLIEQLQYTGPESLNSSNAKYKINLNHPCKALFFSVQLGKWLNNSRYLYHDFTFNSNLYDIIFIRDVATKRVLLALMNQDPESGAYMTPDNAPPQQLTPSGASVIETIYPVGTTFTPLNPNNPKAGYKVDGMYVKLFERLQGYLFAAEYPRLSYMSFFGDALSIEEISSPVTSLQLYTSFEHSYKQTVLFQRPDGTIADFDYVAYKYGINADKSKILVPLAPGIEYSDGAPELDRIVKLPTNLGLFIDGTGEIISKTLLQLNGTDRLSLREGAYFNYVQPYQCFSNSAQPGSCVYSFALNPEDHQPSGTCNFSRIDNATIQIQCETSVVNEFGHHFPIDEYHGNLGTNFYLYAKNYNVLRVLSGMAGLAYSN